MFGFVAKHRGIWPVALICEALGVSRSGFYAWLARCPSSRARRDEMLMAKIRESFVASDRTYRARRVWHDLAGLHTYSAIPDARDLDWQRGLSRPSSTATEGYLTNTVRRHAVGPDLPPQPALPNVPARGASK